MIKDTGPNIIADSMQLIAGRTAQEYNQRKDRQGAFWEDRYHATAIETDEHLHRCLICIDLNMVRAGVVSHPVEWAHSGYSEIQEPPKRYAVIEVRGAGGHVWLPIPEIFKEHTANGSSKRWKTAVLRARTAGLKRSPSGVWDLLSR